MADYKFFADMCMAICVDCNDLKEIIIYGEPKKVFKYINGGFFAEKSVEVYKDSDFIQKKSRVVAHEIRNQLSICDLYSEIIRKSLEKEHDIAWNMYMICFHSTRPDQIWIIKFRRILYRILPAMY